MGEWKNHFANFPQEQQLGLCATNLHSWNEDQKFSRITLYPISVLIRMEYKWRCSYCMIDKCIRWVIVPAAFASWQLWANTTFFPNRNKVHSFFIKARISNNQRRSSHVEAKLLKDAINGLLKNKVNLFSSFQNVPLSHMNQLGFQ